MTRILWLVLCVVQCLGMSQDELEDFSNFLLKTSSLDIHVKKGAYPDGSFDEDEEVSDHAWEESGKFEGDLILNDRQRRLIVETVEGLSRNGLTDSTKRWPDNEVIYFIQREHFTSGQVQAIQDGIEDLGRASCVKFRPYRKGDRDAVVIQGSRRGCFSQVGYQGGYQVLNLSGRHPVGRGCFRHGTVVHELLHTLGFYHMQSSPDRDDYINVLWANIVQPARHNFRKYNSFSVSDFGVGYDYDSVLHYSRKAFSANGQDTLVPKKHGATIGQRVGLSDKDTQKLNKMYCNADNDAVQADENTPQNPKQKKKPKNQPFEGQGIGYHQGKTVVIKLPAAGQTYKLRNVPSIDVFDFSKTPQIVSTSEAEGYKFGKEVTYPYPISLNEKSVTDYQNSYEIKPVLNKNPDKFTTDDKVESSKDDEYGFIVSSPTRANSNDSSDINPAYVPIDTYDKDLNDAFNRLTKIVKQHVYPPNIGYSHRINKDYSKFYTPLESEKSEKSDHVQGPLNERLEHPVLYLKPDIVPQKQIKEKVYEIENSDDNLKNRHLEDRMDYSYRTTLPTKKPYVTYEQTETPPYATLEYLKNRHDFSNLYSPRTPEANEYSDKSFSTKGEEQDTIKINPYDQGFYTDYVIEDSKDRLKQASGEENSKEMKPSKYIIPEILMTKDIGTTNKHLESGIDASFRTVLPTNTPYSAYEHTDTPKYATLDYLKDRHDISSLYKAKTSNDDKQKGYYAVLEDDIPLTEGDWYKESYVHNPANYDKDSYSDYNEQNRKREDEIRSQKTDASQYDDEFETITEASRKSKNGYDYYTPYKKENNDHEHDATGLTDDENREKSKENRNRKQDYYSGYYSGYEKEHAFNDNNDGNRKESKAARYTDDHYNDYSKEGQIKKAPNKNDNEDSHEVPKTTHSYALYGVPVPLTKDWYKPYYSTDVSKEFETSRSHEDVIR